MQHCFQGLTQLLRLSLIPLIEIPEFCTTASAPHVGIPQPFIKPNGFAIALLRQFQLVIVYVKSLSIPVSSGILVIKFDHPTVILNSLIILSHSHECYGSVDQ